VTAAASRAGGRIAISYVESFAAIAAIRLPQIDETRALLVPALLTVHASILTVLTL
jgi:hypothetical protein